MSSEIVSSAIVPIYARADIDVRAGRRLLADDDDGERYLDFGGGIAVASLGLFASPSRRGADEPGRQALAYVQPVPDARRRAPRRAARRRDLRRSRLLHQFRRRGQRGGDQDGAQAPIGRRPSRALSHSDLRGRLSRPHAGDDRRRRPGQISRRASGPRSRASTRFPITDLDAVEAAIGPETAAIMIEPIQGEGGVRVVPPPFLRGLRAICDKHGLLLIFDEIQTGVGRTGRLFAYEHVGRPSRHHDHRQGHRRRLSDGRVPGDRGRRQGPDRRRRMARRSAAIRWRWRSATPCSTSCSRRASSRASPGSGCCCASGLPNSRIAIPQVIEEIRGEGLMIGLKLKVPAGGIRRRCARNQAC